MQSCLKKCGQPSNAGKALRRANDATLSGKDLEVALRHTAVKSIFWSGLENGSTSLLAFLALIVLAKFLQPTDFGVFSISLAVVEIAGIFTNLIFHDALVQRHTITESHFSGAFTVSIILGLVVYALLWVGFPYVAALVGDDRVSDVGRVLGLGLLVTGPAGVLAARQSREFGFRLLAIRTLAGRLCGSALGILSALLGLGLWSLVIQYLAAMVLGAVTLLACSPSHHIRITANLRPVGDLLRYSITAITALAAGFLTKRIFVFGVGIFLGTEPAGFLNLAFRLVDTVWAVSAAAVSQVLLPTLSRLQQDRSRLLRAYRISLKGAAAVLYPGFASLGILAPELIQLLFGSKWTTASPYVLVLSLLTFVQVARLSAAPLLSATGHMTDVCLSNTSTLVYMVAAIALTHLSTDYVALSIWAGSEILIFVTLALALHVRLQVQFVQQLLDILTPLLAALSLIVVVQISRNLLPVDLPPHWKLLELGLIGASTYVALMFAFGRQFMDPVVGMARAILVKE